MDIGAMPDFRKMSFWGLRSGMRHQGPRLARRYPNGESEGILDDLTLIVRPDLRRDIWLVTWKYQVLRRKRVDVEHLGGMSSFQGSTVPSG
jgi:hypothetical protein